MSLHFVSQNFIQAAELLKEKSIQFYSVVSIKLPRQEKFTTALQMHNLKLRATVNQATKGI